MEKLLKNCLLQKLFCSSTIWKEITAVKVLGPRKLQGLLNQSNSSFEGSSKVELQMMIYTALPLVSVPISSAWASRCAWPTAKPWATRGTFSKDPFSRAPSTFSLTRAGFSLQVLDMAHEMCC